MELVNYTLGNGRNIACILIGQSFVFSQKFSDECEIAGGIEVPSYNM